MSQTVGVAMSGEGHGHASRMAALCRRLRDHVDLVIWCPRTVSAFLADKLPGIPQYEIPLTKLHKTGNKVNIIRTGIGNIQTRWMMHTKLSNMQAQFAAHTITTMISDYEPMSCLAAKKSQIPVLAFNHQGVLDRFFPRNITDIAGRLANWFMRPHFDHQIVSSFYYGNVGPLLRDEITSQTPTDGDYFFVYLKPTFRPVFDKIKAAYPELSYRCFPNKTDNLEAAMAGCKAVITPAGHQLLSEALSLKKPVFAVPENGQSEQQLNARMIEAADLGMKATNTTAVQRFTTFLTRLQTSPFRGTSGDHYCLKDDTERALEQVLAAITFLPQSRPNATLTS